MNLQVLSRWSLLGLCLIYFSVVYKRIEHFESNWYFERSFFDYFFFLFFLIVKKTRRRNLRTIRPLDFQLNCFKYCLGNLIITKSNIVELKFHQMLTIAVYRGNIIFKICWPSLRNKDICSISIFFRFSFGLCW